MINFSTPKPLWEIIPNGTAKESSSGEPLFTVSNADSTFSFHIHRSDWDSKHIGKDVYRISSLTSVSDKISSIHTTSLQDWESSLTKSSVIWVRLASEAGNAIRSLESKGFRYISGLNSYIWPVDYSSSLIVSINIRNALLEEALQISDIGGAAFYLDRLFLDPAVDRKIAEKMYRDWSANCVRGLCKTVLVAEINDEIAGFLSLTPDRLFSSSLGAKYQRIVLVAVSTLYRGKGVGFQLVNAAMQRTIDEGYDFLLVGTSALNLPAQNLYSKCGFKPYYSELCLGKST